MSSKLLAALMQRKQSINTATTAAAPTPAPTPEEKKNNGQSNKKKQKKRSHGGMSGEETTGPASTTTNAAATNQQPPTKKQRNQPQPQATPHKQTSKAAPSHTQTRTPSSAASSTAPSRPLSALQQKMASKLAGARFRWLNEKLYTCTSAEAYDYFQQHPEEFDEYHKGFGVQVLEWPVSPLDQFIQYLKERPKLIAGDFGCGEARLSASVPNKVHSFDLVAHNERVVACNMSKVPLPDAALDVAIFCLSLMGVDFMAFIREAHRVLKPNGTLLISEVRSRFEESGIDVFLRAVSEVGFTLKRKDMKNQMFVTLEFTKIPGKGMKTTPTPTPAPATVTPATPQKGAPAKGQKGGAASNKKGKNGAAPSAGTNGKSNFTHPMPKKGAPATNNADAPMLTACIYKKR